MKHVRCQRANIEPVFFAYPDNAEINALVEGVVKGAAPDYDFTAEDGFGHRLWVIRDRKVNDRITEIFRIYRHCTSPTATTVRRLRRVWAKSVYSAIRTIGATRSIASFWP